MRVVVEENANESPLPVEAADLAAMNVFDWASGRLLGELDRFGDELAVWGEGGQIEPAQQQQSCTNGWQAKDDPHSPVKHAVNYPKTATW